MKIYITVENRQRLKRSFLNLKMYSIISVEQILDEYGYSYDTLDEFNTFIVNSKLLDMFNSQIKSKRNRGVIYSNPHLNEEILNNLIEKLNEYEKVSEIVLLDDTNLPKLKHLYGYFDEIIFFPSVKKVRLIECVSLNN